MRNRSDEQLESLNMELVRMDSLCEDAIQGASKALMGESAFVKRVYIIEHEINQKERDIGNLCFKLLLRQQPVAEGSQLMSTALKMIPDIECIGDQVSDIVGVAVYLRDSKVEGKVHISDMTEATMEMVMISIGSLVKKNLEIAREVIKSDGVVDDLLDKIKEELVGLIRENRMNGEFCIGLLMIVKYSERIRDHTTNIAEWVEYSVTEIYIII